MSNKFADNAAYYVGLGWQVFPLGVLGKLPAIKGGRGFKDASDDMDTIDRWGRDYPDANIGVATGAVSGITVIDVDPRHGGNATVTKFAGSGLMFPSGPVARTGNGGRHLVFAHHPSIKPSQSKLGPGIDIKTDGGYIVVAPSIIGPSEQGPGGPYRWTREPTSPTLPALPQWVVQRLLPRPVDRPKFEPISTSEMAEKSLEGMARALATAGQGNRNNLMNWAAFTAGDLVRQGKLSSGHVEARLMQAGLSAGLTLPEIKATLASGLRAGLGGNR